MNTMTITQAVKEASKRVNVYKMGRDTVLDVREDGACRSSTYNCYHAAVDAACRIKAEIALELLGKGGLAGALTIAGPCIARVRHALARGRHMHG